MRWRWPAGSRMMEAEVAEQSAVAARCLGAVEGPLAFLAVDEAKGAGDGFFFAEYAAGEAVDGAGGCFEVCLVNASGGWVEGEVRPKSGEIDAVEVSVDHAIGHARLLLRSVQDRLEDARQLRFRAIWPRPLPCLQFVGCGRFDM